MRERIDIATLLRSLPAPTVPTEELDRRVIGELHEQVVNEAEARLGDALALGLDPVPAPDELDRRFREDLHHEVVLDSERRLRQHQAGDALAEGFAPTPAPADVDWAAAAVEHALDSGNTSAAFDNSAVTTPGWLWARIRSDLHRYRLERRRHARRTLVFRAGVAAATIAVTALLFHVSGRGARDKVRELDIQFVRSDQPLSTSFSTTELARRMRDGR